MALSSLQGKSQVPSVATSVAAPPTRPPAEARPSEPTTSARGSDQLALSETGQQPRMALSDVVQRAKAAQGIAFDVAHASERLIASHGGDLEQAYFESLDLRNTTKQPGYAEKLEAYSRKLGMDRNFTPDELRDVEHFLFAAASTAEKAKPGKDASQLDRSLAVLGREPYAASLAVLTVGYSAAKVVNQALPDGLKFLKSRTAPSLEEVGAGLKGIWRGMKDGI